MSNANYWRWVSTTRHEIDFTSKKQLCSGELPLSSCLQSYRIPEGYSAPWLCTLCTPKAIKNKECPQVSVLMGSPACSGGSALKKSSSIGMYTANQSQSVLAYLSILELPLPASCHVHPFSMDLTEQNVLLYNEGFLRSYPRCILLPCSPKACCQFWDSSLLHPKTLSAGLTALLLARCRRRHYDDDTNNIHISRYMHTFICVQYHMICICVYDVFRFTST